ncbi:MAG: hypothetical protein AB3N14_01570 [Flavobacteriaceae bacterium]
MNKTDGNIFFGALAVLGLLVLIWIIGNLAMNLPASGNQKDPPKNVQHRQPPRTPEQQIETDIEKTIRELGIATNELRGLRRDMQDVKARFEREVDEFKKQLNRLGVAVQILPDNTTNVIHRSINPHVNQRAELILRKLTVRTRILEDNSRMLGDCAIHLNYLLEEQTLLRHKTSQIEWASKTETFNRLRQEIARAHTMADLYLKWKKQNL